MSSIRFDRGYDQWDDYIGTSFEESICIIDNRELVKKYEAIIEFVTKSLEDTKKIKDQDVKIMLRNNLKSVIKKFQLKIKILTYSLPKNHPEMQWNYVKCEDWLKKLVYHKSNYNHEDWSNFFVKHLDYIANPTIKIKNIEICMYFLEYIIPGIRKDP